MQAHDFLTSHGYEHYEVSSFSRPGFESKHNMNYWNRGEYAGFGAAAHGYVDGYRYGNISDVSKYAQSIKNGRAVHAFKDKLSPRQKVLEYLMLGLRTVYGISKKDEMVTGTDFWAKNRELMENLKKNSMARMTSSSFSLSPRGFLMLDEIVAQIKPEGVTQH
jgi:oxygen-independent coproporphyrinogen-3 oxidase